VTNAAMRDRDIDAPLVAPSQAGANLARLAHDHELVFYESFLPDLAGHGRLIEDHGPRTKDQNNATKAPSSLVPGLWSVEAQIHMAIELLDGLIGGVLDTIRPEDTLLITSDHGNVESLAAPAHTRNPVPLLAVGPAAQGFAKVESIAEVADAIDRLAG
jgi:hypothetical protein